MDLLKSSRLERKLRNTSARDLFGGVVMPQSAPETQDYVSPMTREETVRKFRQLQEKTKDSAFAHSLEKEIKFLKKQ